MPSKTKPKPKTKKKVVAKKKTTSARAAKSKVTTKKKTTKAAVKRTTVKKKTTAAVKKLPAISKPYTKSQIVAHMSDAAGITRNQAATALTAFCDVVEASIKPRSCGKFTLSGVLTVGIKVRPKRPARKGINPFTGEMTTFKAKPAKKVVKIRALKGLQDVV
ncbi:MAG: HU family DNA-binding protein [Pseudomonadota bacterium]